VLDVLRETVVELHHEVVEEVAPHPRRAPLRLGATPEAPPSSAKRPQTARRKTAAPRR
jgi:hypothetical protein